MKKGSIRFLALASLALLAMTTSASAASVLSFGIGGPGTKTAATSGTTSTTLSTSSPLPPVTGFPVNITTIGNVMLPPIATIAARETFIGVTSTGAATNVGGTISQPFSGTISYTDPTNPAINFLTITFAGVLRGSAGGMTVSLAADNSLAGQSVSFTSTDARVMPFLADPVKNFEIGLTGLSSGLAITGSTIAGFTTSNQSGNVSSLPIPEPTSVAALHW